MPAPNRKSKFFRVALEGATTDGRNIARSWIEQIVETYNREKYGARIFMEHVRGMNPAWGFRAMGDVLAVKAEEVEIDGVKRLALFAQIEPTEEMVQLVKAGQKIYSSIEVNPNFMESGKAYLVGLGITDTPASLGTEVLAFAAQNPDASPFTARKQGAENLFSAAELSEIELEDVEPERPSLLARVREMFTRKQAGDDANLADVHAAVEHVAQATGDLATSVDERFAALEAANAEQVSGLERQIADLSAKLDHTPTTDPKRPPAAGGSGAVLTDC